MPDEADYESDYNSYHDDYPDYPEDYPDDYPDYPDYPEPQPQPEEEPEEEEPTLRTDSEMCWSLEFPQPRTQPLHGLNVDVGASRVRHS